MRNIPRRGAILCARHVKGGTRLCACQTPRSLREISLSPQNARRPSPEHADPTAALRAAVGERPPQHLHTEQPLVYAVIAIQEAAEGDVQGRGGGEGSAGGLDGDGGGLGGGVPVDAGADAGEGDGSEGAGAGEGEGGAVAGGEEFGFTGGAAVPDRPDSMDDKAGGEAVGTGDFCLSGFTAPEGAGFGEQPGACGAVDCTVDPAAAEQGGVGGVDYGVYLKGGDVGAGKGYSVWVHTVLIISKSVVQ